MDVFRKEAWSYVNFILTLMVLDPLSLPLLDSHPYPRLRQHPHEISSFESASGARGKGNAMALKLDRLHRVYLRII
jgi:hypothetical protein